MTDGTADRRGLRIGVDGTCLASGRGYGRFLRELLPPLIRQAGPDALVLFVDEATAREVELPDLPVVLQQTRVSQALAASGTGSRSPLDLLRMGAGLSGQRLDAFFFPSLYSYFPVPRRIPVAVAIHDTIPERHGDIVFPSRRTRWMWRAKALAARWQARTVITVSEYARRSIAAMLGIPEERIFVTVEAPSPIFKPVDGRAAGRELLAERGIPDAPYFIYVGGMNPHKNVTGLVRAFARVVARGTEPRSRLLLVGDTENDRFHANVQAIRRAVATSGVQDRVHWLGFVPDAELRHLYAGAVAAVLPALQEGFGLPAVEAAACGAPCIATRESALPEVLEGGGIFIDPARGDALTDALATLLDQPDRRASLAAVALKRASQLSWETTARETWRALRSTAGVAP